MSSIWDRTVEVLAGRAGMFVPIAAAAIFLPAVVRAGFAAYAADPVTPALAIVGALVALVALVVTLWGQLAVTAMATDPATTRPDATRQASARLPAFIGVTLAISVAVALLLLPMIVVLSRSGADFTAISNGTGQAAIPPAVAGFVGLYLLVFVIAALFVGARLLLMTPVVLNELVGLRALRRSWALTRGLTWRIVGVFLLFLIVLAVASSAAQFVTGIVFRLILGGDAQATVTFLAAIAGALVSTALTVVAGVFAAQLYVAVSGRGTAEISA